MKPREAKLSHEYLLEILEYFPDTGKFVWKEKIARCIIVGKKAGGKSYGRYVIRINKIIYFRSRLAWFYVYGFWPKNDIDHRNRIADDDRIDNLREATRQENNWNTITIRKKNSHLPKGIYMQGTKFRVQLMHENKTKYLGYFNSLDDALKCRDSFELTHRKFLHS